MEVGFGLSEECSLLTTPGNLFVTFASDFKKGNTVQPTNPVILCAKSQASVTSKRLCWFTYGGEVNCCNDRVFPAKSWREMSRARVCTVKFLLSLQICGRFFNQISHLNTHMLTHGQIKPHVCTICNRAFTQVRQGTYPPLPQTL